MSASRMPVVTSRTAVWTAVRRGNAFEQRTKVADVDCGVLAFEPDVGKRAPGLVVEVRGVRELGIARQIDDAGLLVDLDRVARHAPSLAVR